MAEQFTVVQPDYDRIKNETGVNTADGIQTLWLAVNDEAGSRRAGVREAIERFSPKAIIQSPGVAQNNLDTQFSTVLRFDGSTNVNLTGLRARPDPTFVYLYVLGSGTITLKNESASSIARNRILTYSGGDLALTTGLGAILVYLNSRWREWKAA